MNGNRPLVSFDWAIKRLLRQKANYEVLEGFLTVLLRKPITTIDEWIYYLKNSKLPDHFSAPGLARVEQILNYNNMDAEARALYDAHIKECRISYDVLETAKMEGRQEGREAGRLLTVVNAYKQGISIPVIAVIAGISEEEVLDILQKQGIVE